LLFLARGHALLAYGPAPGVELIPYFLGLLAWVGLAVSAMLLSPLAALLRRLRRRRGAPRAEPTSAPLTASVPESPGEGRHDKA
jgi:hypothetical protein